MRLPLDKVRREALTYVIIDLLDVHNGKMEYDEKRMEAINSFLYIKNKGRVSLRDFVAGYELSKLSTEQLEEKINKKIKEIT